MIHAALEHLAVPVDSLKELPGNPRKGDVDAVARSLARFGQRKPIIVRESDRTITAGNHTWLAAQLLGWTEIAALVLDDDEATSAAFALADNRTSELGTYDDRALLELIEKVGELDPSLLGDAGWSDQAIAELQAQHIDPPDPERDDVAPPLRPDPITQPGDVWILGEHRVVCGDATSLDDVEKALGGALADCLVTDPPYGVAYQGGTKDKLTIKNDDLGEAELGELLDGAFGCAFVVLRPGASFYVFSPSGTLETVFRLSLRNAALPLRQQLVWVKDRFVLGRMDYHGRHETILAGEKPDESSDDEAVLEHENVLYGWKLGAGHTWLGGRKQDTVWECPRPAANPDHPTMKPVELVRRAIENSCPPGGVVLDLFGGSGSTLVAAHATRRKAALVELDPQYVDVIVRRFQTLTGVLPVLEASGEEHSFLEEPAA